MQIQQEKIRKKYEKNTKKIQEYIKNQLEEDKLADQLTMKEYIDQFTGKSVKNNNK